MRKRKRMNWFSVNVVLSMLILLPQNESVSANSCLASMPTLQPVEECPKTQEQWNERSGKKGCDRLTGVSQCSSFVYHCLLNQWGNVTVEVCAPTWYLSGFCAIYNTEQFRIKDNFHLDCNNNTKIKKEDRCPSRYISSDTYKYQLCYNKREQKSPASDHQLNAENGRSAFVMTVVFIVLFILAVITSVILAVSLCRVKCDKQRKKGSTQNHQIDQGLECIQKDPTPEGNQGNTHRNQPNRGNHDDEQEYLLEGNQDPPNSLNTKPGRAEAGQALKDPNYHSKNRTTKPAVNNDPPNSSHTKPGRAEADPPKSLNTKPGQAEVGQALKDPNNHSRNRTPKLAVNNAFKNGKLYTSSGETSATEEPGHVKCQTNKFENMINSNCKDSN